MDDNTQFSAEKSQKASLYHDIQNETGYKLNELEVVDGKFVTEDGTNIFDIYKKSVKEGISVPEEFKLLVIGDTYDKLEELAKNGFDSIPDLVLSIDYENGSFYDVGQSKNFGVGQTNWIEKLQASKIPIDIYA